MESPSSRVDVALIGAGIMSATLGTMLRLVRPDASMALFERLEAPALESSGPWHNAGTGHAALCELHYTPERSDGSIDVAKALLVNDQFQLSLQFYSWMVETGLVEDAATFIRSVPHVGIALGDRGVDFLRRRHDALQTHPQFAATEFADDRATLEAWLPLVMRGRDASEVVAATRHTGGTDVNFGAVTQALVQGLAGSGVEVHTNHQVSNISRDPGGDWVLTVRNRESGDTRTLRAGFVFVGAGGTAIHLLQQSGIAEIKGVGGFPVSGQFLRCTNEDLIAEHQAKVYGQPATGAPPMTAPHLDTRVIDGKRGLLFGPFAGFTPKFLKQGSWFDFAKSIKPDNVLTMLGVARKEMPLTAYLIRQVLLSHEARVDHLRTFMPTANVDDWELIEAGQRVQVMKQAKGKGGVLQFGTEVITAADGSIAGLLGASPGASTATAIMLDVMARCFPRNFETWKPRLQEVVPSLGVNLAQEPALFAELEAQASRTLGLQGS